MGAQDDVAAACKFAFNSIKLIEAVVVEMYPGQVYLNAGHVLVALGLA